MPSDLLVSVSWPAADLSWLVADLPRRDPVMSLLRREVGKPDIWRVIGELCESAKLLRLPTLEWPELFLVVRLLRREASASLSG